MKYCKLSDYAKKYGVTYRTAFNRFNAGKLEGAVRDKTGHICVPIEYLQAPVSTDVTIYATVSGTSNEDAARLDAQAESLVQFCKSRGYHVDKVVKEISSTIAEDRPKLNAILADRNVKHIVVERKSSVSRFAFEQIETLMETDQREIEVVDNTEENREDLTRDFAKTIFAMSKIIGGRRLPKKTIKSFIEKVLLKVDDADLC